MQHLKEAEAEQASKQASKQAKTNWPSMFKHSIMDMLKQLGMAALYASLLYIGESHFKNGTPVGYFEPASGLALAVLLIGGKRYAWGVFLGAVLIHTTTGDSLWESVTIASGDTLQALCGAWLLTRDGKFDLRLQSLRDYLRLILLGGCASITIGALAANTTLLVSGLLAPANYSHSLVQWWMGDTLGVILIAPLILAWLGIRKDWRTAGMMAEATLILGLAILACQAIFLGWWPNNIGIEAKGYWMFLIVTWVAVRIGACGTTVVLTMTAIYALLGAIHGVGYFANDIAQTHLVNYWLYTVILSVIGMALATHFTERKQLEQQLSRRLRHRDVMERISRISLSSATIEELLGKVLDEMLAVFDADRAYFLYPCDPDAPSWSVPMERTRPEWPGAFVRGTVIPMTTEVADVFREVLASTTPLPYGPATSRCIPAAVAEQFSIRSMIQMALRPRVDRPWVIGLHHCAQARAYDEDDLLIFKDIGRRVADALSSMIILKNLRESEENLNRAQAVGQVGSWLFNIATNRLEWSAETYRIFGIPQHESIDLEAFAAAIHPDDRDFVLNAWGEAMAGAPYDIEHRIVVDGQTRWVRERAQIERDSEGQPLTGVGTVQDITERKKAELALKRYKLVIDTVNDGFWITDKMGNIQEANAAYAKMSGYSVDEMMSKHVSQLEAIERSVDEVGTHIEKVVARGYERFETRHRHKDGHEIDVEVSATFMPELQQFFVFIHDITKRKQIEDALRESQARQSAILNNSPYLAWLKDTEGRYLKVNKAYADYARLKDARQVIGKTDFDLWPKDLAEKYRTDDADVMVSRQQKRVEEPSLDGGKMHWVETFKTPVIDQSGNLLGTTGFARDITERKQAEQTLAESESRFREIFNTVSDAIFIHDAATGRIIDVNRRMCEMYGLTREEALACGPDDLSAGTPPYSSAEATEKIHLAHTDGPQMFEWLARARDGHLFWVEVSLRFASICGNQRILATVRDITERKQAEVLIRNLAFYDALTQLPNRRLLNDRLGQSIAASKRSGHYGVLMFLDLDNFKPLNDTHGHGVGDLLLIEVANRLAGCVREVDTVARFGGDEFVVMLGELDADKAESIAQAGIIAEKIRTALAEPYLLKIQQEGKAETTVEHYCAASIGVVVFNSEAGAEDIIKWADTAMYQAKERGRNQVHFFDLKP